MSLKGYHPGKPRVRSNWVYEAGARGPDPHRRLAASDAGGRLWAGRVHVKGGRHDGQAPFRFLGEVEH